MTEDAPQVSVVIPCLNEARTIDACVDKAISAFARAGVRGEVVVSDNGSTDGSVDLAGAHGARVVHAALKGYGHALRKGIEEARGTFIVMGDADDSYDFLELPRFVEKWQAGYEVVMGNRMRGEIKPGAMPWLHRYVGNPVLSGILNLLFRSGIGDAHCGMRGFTKDAYQRMDLRTTGMEFASEFVIKASRLGIRMTEIPITLWPDRRGRPPHLRSFPDGWRHLRFMLLYAPNWLFLAPGAVLATVGMLMVLWLFSGPHHIGRVEFDIHTMFFGMIFVLLGVQILSIGMFARVFSHSERFAPAERSSLGGLLRNVKLETGLIVGLILTLVGLVGDISVFRSWAGGDFGEFSQMRGVIFWSMWFFLGVQTMFSSFFLSMLGISRGTYIGDYDRR
ncbi:MAG TPA: glycosyltransferase family 2 protein [Candidatus Limnocylindrales bacterium]|nr:glycosyltransferase family 2 protein [Candidatus Limnocylindrales bacterium]